jgi:hypothetical protein
MQGGLSRPLALHALHRTPITFETPHVGPPRRVSSSTTKGSFRRTAVTLVISCGTAATLGRRRGGGT